MWGVLDLEASCSRSWEDRQHLAVEVLSAKLFTDLSAESSNSDRQLVVTTTTATTPGRRGLGVGPGAPDR